MMIFNDDEPIVLPPGTTRPTLYQRIGLEITNNNSAPLEENIQKVMLELKGKTQSRSGLDLVMVLDISGSMNGGMLKELQTAMQFVMKKLSVVDRLSIVKYNYDAERLCPLRQMTEITLTDLQNPIQYRNMTNGLLMALKILNDRSVSSGRVGAIMLISGGEENTGNAAAVPVRNVPVHTFGFGNCHDPKVLKDIANNSLGGTYSDVHIDNLTLALSQCLGGLLSVVAQDLRVTISQINDNSTIRQVSAGGYPQSMDDTRGSVTITFGDIYIQEIRKVLVDLHLPSTRMKKDADVLEVSYTYKFNGEMFEAKPQTVTVCRMPRLTTEEQQALPKVRAEEVRLFITEAIKQAIDMFDADEDDLESALDKLENGLLKLEDADIKELKAQLRTELKELLKLLHTRTIYNLKVRPFAYSLLISLATQRQTARGNKIGKFQLFSSPVMQEFLEEAKKLLKISESFNDDKRDDQDSSGSELKPIVPGKVQLKITSNDVAPVEESIQKVLLELSGEENGQLGLDLVAVLDVSSSMEGYKLEKMKMAMLRLTDCARYNYRLSIVEYSTKAKRLCPLRLMTESSKEKLRNLIHDLECQPGTNITDGLETALNVLKGRSSVSSGRIGVIILMSDGEQNQGGDAADFPVGNVPVLTFDFGKDHAEVLIAIASGLGGTYTEVCMDNLNLNFDHFFDELQRVAVWDLTVTINQIKNESTLICASAGRYLQSIDNATGSVTITLGTLYMTEPHSVLVDILLPVTKKDHEAHVLEVSYTYRSSFDGERCEAKHATVTVHRMSYLIAEEQQPKKFEVLFIEARLLIAEMINKATGFADKEHLKSLRDKLVHNLKSLRDIDTRNRDYMRSTRSEMTHMMGELEKLSELIQSQAINENQGRSSAYSLLISHYIQRFKTNYKLPVTPALREFLEEAMMYDDINDLLVYMDRFICAIESIVVIINEFY